MCFLSTKFPNAPAHRPPPPHPILFDRSLKWLLPKSGKGKILNLGPLTKRRQTDVLPLLSWTEKAFSKTQLDINTLFTERKVRIACTTSITMFGNKESKKMYSSKFLNFYWLVFFFLFFFFVYQFSIDPSMDFLKLIRLN